MGPYSYDFPRPALSVDIVAFHGDVTSRRLLLIRRGAEPFIGTWALPGGFVEEYEEPETAALRELAEETGVTLPYSVLPRIVGAYGERGRDPRGWTVSVVFVADLGTAGDAPAARGADDAEEACWWPTGALPELAFDHAAIIADALDMGRP